MTPLDIAAGILSTGVCLGILRFAVRVNRSWPSFYRVFLLLFFAVWSAVLWVRRPPEGAGLALVSLVVLAAAIAAGFVPLPPPKNRRETKNLLDLIETERSLDRFFSSDIGRLFWPILGLLVFSVALRLWLLARTGLALPG